MLYPFFYTLHTQRMQTVAQSHYYRHVFVCLKIDRVKWSINLIWTCDDYMIWLTKSKSKLITINLKSVI